MISNCYICMSIEFFWTKIILKISTVWGTQYRFKIKYGVKIFPGEFFFNFSDISFYHQLLFRYKTYTHIDAVQILQK